MPGLPIPIHGDMRSSYMLDAPMANGHNPDMTPEQLKRIRARLTMTQAQLAATLGVRQETVARWEIGSRGIPEPTARLIE